MKNSNIHEQLPAEQTELTSPIGRMPSSLKKTVAGLAIAGALFGIHENHQSNKEDYAQRLEAIESEAVAEVQTAFNGAVVVNKGAAIRSEPRRSDPDPDILSLPSNVEKRVGDGEALLIDNPLVFIDSDRETWYGFNLDIESDEQENPLYWVNATALEEENDDYVQTFAREGEDIEVNVADNGAISHQGNSGTSIAEASLVPVENLTVELEKLTKNH